MHISAAAEMQLVSREALQGGLKFGPSKRLEITFFKSPGEK